MIADLPQRLQAELSKSKTDSARLVACQQAFELVISDFDLCRPPLERIKQQYDRVSCGLLAKKRALLLSGAALATADDTLCQMVQAIRQGRSSEAGQDRIEADRLLDELTALRLQRSDLLRELGGLKRKREEVEGEVTVYDKEAVEINGRTEELQVELLEMEGRVRESKKELAVVAEKLAKTNIATADLEERERVLKGELEKVRKILRKAKQRLEEIERRGEEEDRRVAEERRELGTLQGEMEEALALRAEAIAMRDSSELELRELLKTQNRPLEELLALAAV